MVHHVQQFSDRFCLRRLCSGGYDLGADLLGRPSACGLAYSARPGRDPSVELVLSAIEAE